MSGFKRNLFLHLNRFQLRILFYLTALGFTCLALMVLFLSYLYADSENFIHQPQFFTIKMCIVVALPITALLILIICLYTYRMTNKLFGAHYRIIREIDDVLEAGKKRELSVRRGDELFQELVDRLNKLIQRLP